VNAAHLYVHVPFCARRCTYCDFSIAVRRRTPVREFVGALELELALAGIPPRLRTVYLGGGTPSRLGAEGVARLAAMLGSPGSLDEFTLEANPEDVTVEAVRAWVGAGVTRLSIGAQSFDDRVLKWMHRTHDRDAIAPAVRAAREGGIRQVSLDLIFALPDVLERDWGRDLEQAIALAPDHVSLYGLTVEPGTPLARQMDRGAVTSSSDVRYETEYLHAHDRLTSAGYAFYEVSNAARPGAEAVHNRAYWRLVPYLGVGPSAHSFDGTSRWWNEPAYARWLERLAAGQSPVAGREVIGARQRELEQLYLGLRTSVGVDLAAPEARRLAQVAGQWVRAGWAERSEAGRLRLTAHGWLRLDELVASV